MSFSDFEFIMKCSRNDFIYDKPISDKNSVYRLSNLIFVCTKSKYLCVQQSDDEIKFSYGSEHLSKVEIKWNVKKKVLSINLDDLGLSNIFYVESDENIFISNTTVLLEKNVKHGKLSERNILFFLIAGFLPVGWSFWADMQRVDKRIEIDLNLKNKLTEKSNWQSNFLTKSECTENIYVDNVLESLSDSLKHIKDYCSPDELRMSGGIDSRLISVLWKYEPLNTVVVQSPWVKEEEDLDVNISRAWANHLKWPHKVLKPSSEGFGFFIETQGKNVLTGLCGGEFLGGQFHRVINTSPKLWAHTAAEIFPGKNLDFLNDDGWVNDVISSEEKWLVESLRVFIQSSRSTLYRSYKNSWATPFQMHAKYLSPFVTPHFLKLFLNIPIDIIGDYNLYEKIFLALKPELEKVPLCSQITHRIPQMNANPAFGLNPKFRYDKNFLEPDRRAQADRLSKLLAQNNIYLSAESLYQMLLNSKTKFKVLSLLNWMSVRFSLQK